jgi:hypothetical protein
MQPMEAAAATPPAAMSVASTVDDPRSFARGLAIGAAASAPAWILLALAVHAVFG